MSMMKRTFFKILGRYLLFHIKLSHKSINFYDLEAIVNFFSKEDENIAKLNPYQSFSVENHFYAVALCFVGNCLTNGSKSFIIELIFSQ